MKYIISVFMLMSFCVTSIQAQEDIDPILIGGVGKIYHNNNDQGHYNYAYFDYKPIQNRMGNTALGIYAKYNYWNGIYNDSIIEEINSYGIGLSYGFIPNYFFNYDVYNNVSVGYRQSKHLSWNSEKELPEKNKEFIDITMYSHFMDQYAQVFFRHKIFLDISYNTDSSLVNEYVRIRVDESVYNFYLGDRLNLAPKIILGYTHNAWNNFYEFGVGLDLFWKWFVNIVDTSIIYKHDPQKKDYIELSIGIDAFNLFNN